MSNIIINKEWVVSEFWCSIWIFIFCFSYNPTHSTGFHGIVNLTYLEFPQTLHECDAQLSFHGEQTSRGRFYNYCSTPRHQIIEENIKFGFTLQRRPFLFNYTNNNSNRSGEFWINVKGLYKNMIILTSQWKFSAFISQFVLFYSCLPPSGNNQTDKEKDVYLLCFRSL